MSSSDFRLRLCLGDTPLVFCFADAALFRAAKHEYQCFETNGSGHLVLIDVPSATVGVQLETKGCRSYTVQGCSVLACDGVTVCRSVTSLVHLESILRVVLIESLLQAPGILLHACTVVEGGAGYVFMGRSGAGKSTVAQLSAPRPVLNDEVSLVRFCGDQVYCYGTPFWGKSRMPDVPIKVPLAGMYSLVQSPEDCVRPLDLRDSVRTLLKNVLFPEGHEGLFPQLLDGIQHIAESRPVSDLHFRRDSSFWRAISNDQ